MNGHPFRNLAVHFLAVVIHYSGLGWILWRILRLNGLFVFNYHGFNSFTCDYRRFGSLFESGYRGRFEKQMRFFGRRMRRLEGFPPGSPGSFESPTFCVTFDDGYRDNHGIALPVLTEYRIPAVFFITTDVIGGDDLLWYDRVRWACEQNSRPRPWNSARLKRRCRQRLQDLKIRQSVVATNTSPGAPAGEKQHPRLMMNWEEVADAFSRGVEVGAHTCSHPILAKLERGDQEREIRDSLAAIKLRLGRNPVLFAFPDGGRESFSPETLELLNEFGISWAFTTIEGVNRNMKRPLMLKRIGINPSDIVPLAALKLLRACWRERGEGRV